jgi:hypothetical protein
VTTLASLLDVICLLLAPCYISITYRKEVMLLMHYYYGRCVFARGGGLYDPLTTRETQLVTTPLFYCVWTI